MKRDHTTPETLTNVISKIKALKREKLSVWDIDDTLFKTPPKHLKIYIVDKNNKRIMVGGKPLSVTTEEFADQEHLDNILKKYNGKLDQQSSFGSFRDPRIFSKHAKPISQNLKVALEEYKNAVGGKKNVFFMALTARDNMDQEGLEDFLNHFTKHGLNMKRKHSHIVRARSVTVLNGSVAKRLILTKILSQCNFIKMVEFWDDSSANISEFDKLGLKFPSVEFKSNHIKKA